MATGRATKLTGAVGEFLVSAELCRRGLVATPFSGNVPHYDIIASDAKGGHLAVQVKTINKVNWQFDVTKFIEVTMDGDRQVLGGPVAEPYPNLLCVFVALGNSNKPDRFFIFTWQELSAVVRNHHRAYLEKHGGVRPKAPKSTHVSISISELQQYENKWEKILEAIRQ
jgi:hypothetical protein